MPARGTVSTDHLVPLKDSAAACVTCSLPAAPTATQLVAEVQDTPNRSAIFDPFGPVHLVAVHVVPFHTSANADMVVAFVS